METGPRAGAPGGAGKPSGLEEDTLRRLMSSAQECIFTFEDGVVTECNERFARLVGWKVDELVGKSVMVVVPAAAKALAGARLAEGWQGIDEVEFLHKDGRSVRARINVRHIQVAGRSLTICEATPVGGTTAGGLGLSAAEIQRLIEADQLKTRILNMAAHELNTPITPLRLQLHLLLSGALGTLETRQRQALLVLDRNVNRLSGLVSEILDVSRLQAGKMRLASEALAVDQAIHEAIESFAEAARRVDVSLGVQVTSGLNLQADRERTQQVLFNLISNALKFTPAGGEVTLRAAAEGDNVRIDISDTGVGMTPEQMSGLFQPFSQVHDTKKIDVPGTGLGLFICKGIVEAMGGTIAATSAGPGTGSTFTILLPKAGAPPAKPLEETQLLAKLSPREALAQRLRELI